MNCFHCWTSLTSTSSSNGVSIEFRVADNLAIAGSALPLFPKEEEKTLDGRSKPWQGRHHRSLFNSCFSITLTMLQKKPTHFLPSPSLFPQWNSTSYNETATCNMKGVRLGGRNHERDVPPRPRYNPSFLATSQKEDILQNGFLFILFCQARAVALLKTISPGRLSVTWDIGNYTQGTSRRPGGRPVEHLTFCLF